ncbi:uncharacterized protein [Montipora foliosa]|uniref:uncharacterized protein n=1 Tax=Montipora foliosa TaxID=591990 RepID=UPI0035F20997
MPTIVMKTPLAPIHKDPFIVHAIKVSEATALPVQVWKSARLKLYKGLRGRQLLQLGSTYNRVRMGPAETHHVNVLTTQSGRIQVSSAAAHLGSSHSKIRSKQPRMSSSQTRASEKPWPNS